MPLPVETSEVLVMNYSVLIPTLAPSYASVRSPSMSYTVDTLHYVGLSTTASLINTTTSVVSDSNGASTTESPLVSEDRPLLATILLAIALSIIVVLTITGNVLVIASVILYSNLRTTTNYFIANLAIADLLLGTTVLPFSATLEVLQYWVFGQIFCDMWAAIDVLCCTASILSLCVISIDRYIGVTRPLQHARIMRHARAVYVIILVWLLSLIISVAPLIGWKQAPHPDPRVCTVTTQPGYVLFSVAGSFYIPCLIILGVYFRIYKETVKYTRCLKAGAKTARVDQENVVSLRIHTGRTVNNGGAGSYSYTYQQAESSGCSANDAMENVNEFNNGMNCSSSYGLSGQRKNRSPGSGKRTSRLALSNKIARFKREKKAAKTLGIVVGVFITCWLPFFIILPLDSLCPNCSVPPLLFNLFFWLGYCNSTMNPIIYTCSSIEFRRAFLSILCCRRCHRRPKTSLAGMHMRTWVHKNGQRHELFQQQGKKHLESDRHGDILEFSLSKKSNSSGSSTFNTTSVDHKSSCGGSPTPLDPEDVCNSEIDNRSQCLNRSYTGSLSHQASYDTLERCGAGEYRTSELVALPNGIEMDEFSNANTDCTRACETSELVGKFSSGYKIASPESSQKKIVFRKLSQISSAPVPFTYENDDSPRKLASIIRSCSLPLKSHRFGAPKSVSVAFLATNDLVKNKNTLEFDGTSRYSPAETMACNE